MNSIAHHSPIVQEMVLRILLQADFESAKDRHRIDSDMVPNISEKIHKDINNFQESTSLSENSKTEEKISVVYEAQTVPSKIISPPKIVSRLSPNIELQARKFAPRRLNAQKLGQEIGQHQAQIFQKNIQQGGYGKLTPMINDPSISHISLGANNQIKIVKRGREQLLNITLTQEEVNTILKYLSEKSRIPFDAEGGVFRVAVDNMLFNAIISKELGTRLMIRKNFQVSPDIREAFQ